MAIVRGILWGMRQRPIVKDIVTVHSHDAEHDGDRGVPRANRLLAPRRAVPGSARARGAGGRRSLLAFGRAPWHQVGARSRLQDQRWIRTDDGAGRSILLLGGSPPREMEGMVPMMRSGPHLHIRPDDNSTLRRTISNWAPALLVVARNNPTRSRTQWPTVKARELDRSPITTPQPNYSLMGRHSRRRIGGTSSIMQQHQAAAESKTRTSTKRATAVSVDNDGHAGPGGLKVDAGQLKGQVDVARRTRDRDSRCEKVKQRSDSQMNEWMNERRAD